MSRTAAAYLMAGSVYLLAGLFMASLLILVSLSIVLFVAILSVSRMIFADTLKCLSVNKWQKVAATDRNDMGNLSRANKKKLSGVLFGLKVYASQLDMIGLPQSGDAVRDVASTILAEVKDAPAPPEPRGAEIIIFPPGGRSHAELD